MHRLLKRQLQRIYGKDYVREQASEKEQQLYAQIEETYVMHGQERKFLEHTIDVNTMELNEKNQIMSEAMATLAAGQRLNNTGSWKLDLSTKTMEWSDELYRIFNAQPGAFAPDMMYALSHVHPEDTMLVDSEMEQVMQAGKFETNYRLKMEPSEIKYVHDYRELILDAAGNPKAVQGIIQDVTKKHQAEIQLKLYADVFHNAGEAILLTDEKRRIIAVNQTFTEVTGYTIDDVYGLGTEMLSDGEVLRRDFIAMSLALQKEGFWSGETQAKHKDGRVFPARMSISVSRDYTGAITNYIGIFADIAEMKKAQERIHYLAHHDTLTGLINRHSLEDRLEQALLISHRRSEKMAVMFMDMDRFKLVNDTLGHQAGDEMLIEIAKRIRQNTRESDIAARIGGDEFVLVLMDVSDALVVADMAQNLVDVLSRPYKLQGKSVNSSPSIGIAIYPQDGLMCDALMKNADSAMYHAKELGRNGYQFFTEALNQVAKERRELEHDLREALAHEQFTLVYQPQIDTKKQNIYGVEALIRWFHPTRGFVMPDVFIGIAEQSKLVVPLGNWVLEEACRQHQAWKKEFGQSVRIAVNISVQHLLSSDLVENIAILLRKYDVEVGKLSIEITETAAMIDPDLAISQLHAIRSLGVDLAIDDFGTGYSSLVYLKSMPIDTLKLDRTFVSEIGKHGHDAEICAATLALAHTLGLSVVGEGVETLDQQQFLMQRDCEVLQGYFYSRPLSVTDVEAFMFTDENVADIQKKLSTKN